MSTPTSYEHLIHSNKIAVDTTLNLFHNALNSVEKLASLNLSNARQSLTEQLQSNQNLLSATNLQDFISLQTSLAQPQIEKTLSYSRDAYAISTEAQEAFIKSIEAWHAEINHSITSSLENLLSRSSHSDVAVNAVKSAISVANSAFENAHKAARQVANITEASVKAASSATVRAVDAANQSSRKKAA